MTPLRIAFLTPEFVTDCPEAGGLASYLARITKALRDLEIGRASCRDRV